MQTLLKPPKNKTTKFHLKIIPKFIPVEFQRRLAGGIESLSFWKATEYRLFLLYVGIVVTVSPLCENEIWIKFLSNDFIQY